MSQGGASSPKNKPPKGNEPERRRRGQALGSPVEQPDYNWTTPFGSILNGSGKDEHINGVKITEAEARALRKYTDSSHINMVLGKADGDLNSPIFSDAEREQVRNMDSAIEGFGWNKTETNTPFVRGAGAITCGVPTNYMTPQEIVDYINTKRIGTKNVNVGYTSICRKSNVASSFSGNQKNPVVLEYRTIGKGMRGVFVSGGNGKMPISGFGTNENETLLQRNVVTVPVYAYLGSDGRPRVVVDAFPLKKGDTGWTTNKGI